MLKNLVLGVTAAAIAWGLAAPAANPEGQWQRIENQPNCEVWNADPSPGETVTWTGRCLDGLAEAEGELVWRYLADGIVVEGIYVGALKGGKTEGRGIFTFTSGARYEGNWQAGDKHGPGVYVWPSGARYDGNWLDGHRSGYGVYIWASGNHYEGNWLESKINGFGVKTWVSGARYEGEWLDEKPHGDGVLVAADGTVYKGIWTLGCFDDGGLRRIVGTTNAACGF